MCRNIRPLFNFEPAATEEEIRAAAVQFVRKISGFARPSRANEAAFNSAVEHVHAAAQTLLRELVTAAPARNREAEQQRASMASRRRFASDLKA